MWIDLDNRINGKVLKNMSFMISAYSLVKHLVLKSYLKVTNRTR